MLARRVWRDRSLDAAGMVAKATSAAEFKMRVAGDVAKWASVIADANMERI